MPIGVLLWVLSSYNQNHPILYAGPAKTPEGYPCGSMRPTTANRMVPYVDEFQDHGASLVMIANKDIFIPHYFADTIFFRNFAKNSIKKQQHEISYRNTRFWKNQK